MKIWNKKKLSKNYLTCWTSSVKFLSNILLSVSAAKLMASGLALIATINNRILSVCAIVRTQSCKKKHSRKHQQTDPAKQDSTENIPFIKKIYWYMCPRDSRKIWNNEDFLRNSLWTTEKVARYQDSIVDFNLTKFEPNM